MGIKKIIVCITKMDTVNWSNERFNLIKQDLQNWFDNFCPFKYIYFIPISAYYYQNIDEKIDNNICNWYDDKCLFDILYEYDYINKNIDKVRLAISNKTKESGLTYLYGKIESGIINNYDNLIINPLFEKIQISDLYDTNNNIKHKAIMGDDVKIKIKNSNIDFDKIKIGMILSNQIINSFNTFIAQIKTFNLKNIVISNGYSCIMHLNVGIYNVVIKNILCKNNKNYLLSNETVDIVIESNENICGEKYNDFSKFGVFLLRTNNKTIACGKINKIKPLNLNKKIINHNLECSSNETFILMNDFDVIDYDCDIFYKCL